MDGGCYYESYGIMYMIKQQVEMRVGPTQTSNTSFFFINNGNKLQLVRPLTSDVTRTTSYTVC
ncbi:hypothetical protein DPMN_025793 [Dreissena polymorpha]|uniref:Uncharacterized protein n=1 Tax=Dreissena polymorpha TaxID=45954 RepID=A0A9D4LS59_DREPO|nr:hypothetical protein DPMN_025793 [Dreissena polymorpha]